jgi:hypothetical protein
VGVNVTLIAQLVPADSLVPQLLVCAKSPNTVTPPIEMMSLPVLLNVSDWSALAVFSIWLEKTRLETEKLAVEELLFDEEPELAGDWLEPPQPAKAMHARVAIISR